MVVSICVDSLGVPSFIEANLMPGLTDHGYLSRCMMLNDEIGYDEMISSIVMLASERCVEATQRVTLEGLSDIGIEEGILQEV